MITSSVNVASTFPGLYLVEAWGRRPLLMFGAVGMCVCQFIVAAVGTALPHQKSAQNALVAFVCIYIFFFACSVCEFSSLNNPFQLISLDRS
jgi:MFS transporter, SP family, sugar:H+ symporter